MTQLVEMLAGPVAVLHIQGIHSVVVVDSTEPETPEVVVGVVAGAVAGAVVVGSEGCNSHS